MENNRLNDMINRYGEVCTQQVAGKILNVDPRTIYRMTRDGRLRAVEHRVDVRSICEYIENPRHADFATRAERSKPRTQIPTVDFMTAARAGRWNR